MIFFFIFQGVYSMLLIVDSTSIHKIPPEKLLFYMYYPLDGVLRSQ